MIQQIHLCEDIFVEMSLKTAHFHPQYTLALCRQRREHIALQSSQHQRLELLMQLFNFRLVVSIVQVKLVRECD
jgi:hypothetical protein